MIKRHPDVNLSKLNVDLFFDASCLGHLLRPSISIKNRVINNVVNNICNNNHIILRLLPETAIRYGWAKGDINPADLTSKLFLTPSKIINGSFYRNGPLDYLKEDPYGHVFLAVTKDGEQYNPPPAEIAVVSTDHCGICKVPDHCLIFLANLSRSVHPHRACKQKVIQHQQLHDPADNTGNIKGKATVKKTVEPEKSKHETVNNEHGNNEEENP